jgi:choline dehydrogenase-like flavoprotein
VTLNRLRDSGILLSSSDGSPLVQRTTLSIDGLGRYICNTWDEVVAAQVSLPFDVIIVGSGMYGGYCAAKLFEFGFSAPSPPPRVLVLESGPFLITQHVQNLPRLGSLDITVLSSLIDPAQVGPLGAGFVPHHRCVGGKSLFWGGWTPRLTDDDFAKGWPPEVVTYLKTQAAAGTGSTDGYEAVEQENGTWPVADFINGALFEILRARASEVLHPPAGALSVLRPVPNFPAPADLAWQTFKANAPAAAWNLLSPAQQAAQFAALEQVGAQLDAAPDFSPINPTIGVMSTSPGSGLFATNKFSSLPLLIDAIREDSDNSGSRDGARRLFLVPHAEVLRLETREGVVRELVVALHDPQEPDNRAAARVVRLGLQQGAQVVLAGNTINSTRLALNSFPRPAELEPRAELMGRNLMAHGRGNFFWRIERERLSVPPELPSELETAALHVRGVVNTGHGTGQFHFQFYATPNMAAQASSPEQFLYRMVPNLEDLDTILDAQRAGKIVVGIRCTGETFGDKVSPIGSRSDVGWMSVNPFGGPGDDIYQENGAELRVPKAFVNLVESNDDRVVRTAQTGTAFQFVAALAGVPVNDARDETDGAPVQFIRSGSGEDRLGTTYHESGTLWMGEDYTSSVTDSQGHFHHVSNAYVTDQSLFPSVGSANPVNTGMALTRMVARGIMSRFASSPVAALEAGFQRLLSNNFAADGWGYVGPLFDGAIPFFDVSDGGPVIGAAKEGPGFDSVLGVLWFSTRSFSDFILMLDFRTFDERANGGIFIRAPQPVILDETNFYNSATEIQIDERGFHFDPPRSFYGHPLNKTGAVYGVFPARQVAHRVVGPRGSSRSGLWNSYEIRAEGANISVLLNGRLVSSGTLPRLQAPNAPNAPNADPLFKRADGFIGLQCHTEVVQYRNIRIRPLP